MAGDRPPKYRFGKQPKKSDYRTLRLARYLTTDLPPPPDAYDALAVVQTNLPGSTVAGLFPMDGNDTVGDCTIAALAHAITLFRALVSQKLVMAVSDVLKLYYQLTGGADTGMPELDVLNFWRQNVIAGDEILGYVGVDPHNHDHVKQAIRLFGGVYLGFQVQEAAEDDFSAGRVWTPGPLLNEGHAVFAPTYDPNLIKVLTWGGVQSGTWDWWDETVDEAYAILAPEAKTPGFAPGFDFYQLQADLSKVTNGGSTT